MTIGVLRRLYRENKIKYNKYQVFSIARKKATKILKRKITFKIIDITKKKKFSKN